jgi:hypothetical protein
MKKFKLFVEYILEKYHHYPKHSKAEAGYQPRPYKGQICKLCTMWRPPNGCTAVAGYINPKGWCRWYKRSKLPAGHTEEG